MTDAQAKVYLAIRLGAAVDEAPSYAEIGEACRMAKSSVAKHVKALVALGVLVKKRGARGLRLKKRRAA